MNRMKLWRLRKRSQEAGRLTQICIWAPERVAEMVRDICTRVAEPTARGEHLRSKLRRQLTRRRTICYEWRGHSATVEVDYPFMGPYWFMKNIGGRVIGPAPTHIELTPDEADDLMMRLSSCCDREIESWLDERKLFGLVRDDTGVVIGHDAPQDTRRPHDDDEFAANEARIAKEHTEAAIVSRKPPVDDPSIIQYEGFHGFPSFCQVAHRTHAGRVQFALIHMPNGGTSPTNMLESLATHLRHHFYPEVDAGRIDWFDVVPPDLYKFIGFTIHPVTMEYANGVYSNPSWEAPNVDISEDWRTFIAETIARGRPARAIAEAAPHQDPLPGAAGRQPKTTGSTKRR